MGIIDYLKGLISPTETPVRSPAPDLSLDPRSQAVEVFNIEAPRLYSIIYDSVNIINQTQNKDTAAHRFDLIKKTAQHLLEIGEKASKNVVININGKQMRTAGDLHLIDDEQSKWTPEPLIKKTENRERSIADQPLDEVRKAIAEGDIDKAARLAFEEAKSTAAIHGYEFDETSPFGNPLLASANATAIFSKKISIRDFDNDKMKLFRTELAYGVLMGESVDTIERNIRYIFFEDFDWQEFTVWFNIFRDSDKWPCLWETIGNYVHIQNYSLPDLLQELKKDNLMALAEAHQIKIMKSWTKVKMIGVLAGSLSERAIKEEILILVNKIWYPRYLREKRMLLIHTEISSSMEDNRIGYWQHNGEKAIELINTDDCIFCTSLKKVYPIDSVPRISHERHPGCRCSLLPRG